MATEGKGEVLVRINVEVPMPYFKREIENIYWCPNCKAWFTVAKINCLVKHPAGTCCHEYEKTVSGPPMPPALKEAMANWGKKS